jgi:hypothetical protein
MKKIFQYLIILFTAAGLFSCDDEWTDDIVKDNKPEIPVTYPGTTSVGFNPYYTVSISGNGDIGIVMEIPSTSGHTIKSIKKIVAGATGLTPGNLNDATVPYATDIAVNATTATFNTSITEFNTRMSAANDVPASIPAGTYVERAFMFTIVLDDDSEIIPVQLRVRFVP